MPLRKRAGFTLVEFIVVVAIIFLLMALMAPATRRVRPRDTTPIPTQVSPGEVYANARTDSQP